MPEGVIPITPEAARDLGRQLFDQNALTPDTSVAAAGKKFREGKAEEALKELAAPSTVPHDRRDVRDSLINRYSTERDADGKRIDPTDAQERRRLREAKRKVETYRDFLENGTISTEIRNEVGAFLRRSSVAFQEAIVGKTPAEVYAMVDDHILKDPVFRSKLIAVYSERAKPKQSLTGEKNVHDLELQLAKLEAKLTGEVTEAQLQTAEINLTTAETALTAAEVNITDLAGHQTDFDTLSTQINEARTNVSTLGTAHGAIDAQIIALDSTLTGGGIAHGSQEWGRISNEIAKLRANPDYVNFKKATLVVARYDSARNYLNALTAPERTAIQNFSTAQTKRQELKESSAQALKPQEKADIDAQIVNLKMELADAKDLLQREMIDDYRSVTHMAEDVAQQMLAEQLQRLPELYRSAKRAEQTKEQERLTDVTEKLQKTWKDPSITRGVMSLVTNRARAGQWINAWTQRGNEGIRAQMNGLTNPDLRAAGLTTEDIALFRTTLADPVKSKAFLAESADIVATRALADYVSSGGRFGRTEMTAITSSDKGRELMKRVMADVQAQRSARNEMAGKGMLKGIDNIIGGRASGESRPHGAGRIGLAMLLLIFGLSAAKGSKS